MYRIDKTCVNCGKGPLAFCRRSTTDRVKSFILINKRKLICPNCLHKAWYRVNLEEDTLVG